MGWLGEINVLSMNIPNALTIARIMALFVLVAILLFPFDGAHSLAFILFILTALTDWLDGYLARRYNLVTNFGKLMDALADKILIMGMFVVIAAMGVTPEWTVLLLLIMLSREFLITGLRLIAATRGKVLSAEKAGKLKTILQIVCLSVYLLDLAFARDSFYTNMAEVFPLVHYLSEIGLGLFVLSTLLTFTSGCGYLIRHADLLKEPPQPHDS